MTSPYLDLPLRGESEIRAIRARRCQLEQDMRAEGTPEHIIAIAATDEVASRMVEHERHVMDWITGLFGPKQ